MLLRTTRHGMVLSTRGGWRCAEVVTFLATPVSFLGAFFLVTPVGLAPLASALGAAAFLGAALRLMVGAVSMTGTTRGLELPVADRVSRAMSEDLVWAGGLRK